MENKILTFLSKHPRHAWKALEISQRLKMETHQRRELRQTLKDLSKQGKIIRYRGNRYASLTSSPTIAGTLKIHYEGYGFLIPDDSAETDVFIPAKNINYALPSDRVLVTFHEKKEDKRREGKVLQIIQHGRTHWIGRLEKRGKAYYVMNDELVTSIEILIPRDQLQGARVGQTVVVKVSQYPGPAKVMMGEIVEVLGSPRDEKTESTAILVRHGIHRSFPNKVLHESQRLPEEILEEECEKRVDLRAFPLLTIDGIDARDFDDAVCVKKKGSFYHLYVSIADVAHYVLAGSAIDEEALARGTSVYFPDFVVPMLPEKLSNNLCSLKAGQDRLALTCEIKFNEEGKALEAWVYESVIKSQKRGIYDEVQSLFDGAPFSEETYSPDLLKSLYEMKKLAEILIRNREKRGALEFNFPEAFVVYNKEGKISAITKAERFFSHRLIEELMIAANVAVASLFLQLQLPFLYRVHDQPEASHIQDFLTFVRQLGIKLPKTVFKKPKDFAGLLKNIRSNPLEPLVHQVLLRSMKQAIYDADNRGHFGLSLKSYCHYTSPIRRYPDLVVHRQLKRLLQHSKNKKLHLHLSSKKEEPRKGHTSLKSFYSYDDAHYLGEVCSKREREATEAEREMINLKRALFMQEHMGDKFFGTIRRITKFGMFVELEPFYVDGLLHISDLTDDYYRYDERKMRLVGKRKRRKVYQVGDKIWVRVKDVSVENRMVALELASN